MSRLIAVVLLLGLAHACGCQDAKRPPAAVRLLSLRRCPKNPLITPASSESIGGNINGPSVIRVPAWIKSPLGTYYMYFAHHRGEYIRLAYADSLEGPWKIYEPGTLKLQQAAPRFKGHIASPDVHVDDAKKEIRMYFHGRIKNTKEQRTVVAVSRDGLHFNASNKILGMPYFRVFEKDEHFYAIDRQGDLLRSKDPMGEFEQRKKNLIGPVRHTCVLRRGDILVVFYSRRGDAPERILASTVRLTDDWCDWTASEPIEVLAPEKDYEGIQYPVKPSRKGRGLRVRQLRDPCIFEERGKTYLFYSIAGEMGIAMAELKIAVEDTAESGSRGAPAPGSDTTLRAGPHTPSPRLRSTSRVVHDSTPVHGDDGQ